MREFLPLLIVGAVIGVVATVFLIAFLFMKAKKELNFFDRHMSDGELTKRLLRYARPHLKSFILVFIIMLFSITYDIASPLIIGRKLFAFL